GQPRLPPRPRLRAPRGEARRLRRRDRAGQGGGVTAGASGTASGLRLKAEDDEDFGVVSACLQDALIPAGDMRFLEAESRFVLVANRFRWENCGETSEMPLPAQAPVLDVAFGPGCRAYERVLCGVTFEGVTRVRYRGFDPAEHGRILALLAVHPAGAAEAGGPGAVVLE